MEEQSASVPLRDHVEALVGELSKRFDGEIVAVREAVKVYLDTSKDKFASVNEFRQLVNDAQAKYASRDWVDATVSKLESRIDSQQHDVNTKHASTLAEFKTVNTYMDQARGKASQAQVWGAYVASVVSAILSAAIALLK